MTQAKARFTYDYDFGDNWHHTILVEKILDPESGVTYPRCIKGKRAGPPEDVGGVWGYYALLEALADPNSEQHAWALEWVGDDFDPENFEIDAVNKRLAAIHQSTF